MPAEKLGLFGVAASSAKPAPVSKVKQRMVAGSSQKPVDPDDDELLDDDEEELLDEDELLDEEALVDELDDELLEADEEALDDDEDVLLDDEEAPPSPGGPLPCVEKAQALPSVAAMTLAIPAARSAENGIRATIHRAAP